MRPRAPCWLRLTALLFLWTCACATVPPPAVAHEHDDAAFVFGIIARVLADACTARPTDAILVEHTTLLLKACHMDAHKCIRHVCIRLGRGNDDDPYREVR